MEERKYTFTAIFYILFLFAGLFIAYKIGGKWWQYILASLIVGGAGSFIGNMIDLSLVRSGSVVIDTTLKEEPFVYDPSKFGYQG